MSKKEEVLNSLSLWQSYQGKMLTTFIALCGFAFGAAGGVVSVPLWLTAVSMIGVVLIGISVILLHRKIIKLQHELGSYDKYHYSNLCDGLLVCGAFLYHKRR